jgi:hypothetical protein
MSAARERKERMLALEEEAKAWVRARRSARAGWFYDLPGRGREADRQTNPACSNGLNVLSLCPNEGCTPQGTRAETAVHCC